MLDAHGITDRSIGEMRAGNAPVPAEYARLLEQLMCVADRHYAQASEGIVKLPTFFRAAVAVSARVYGGIHDAIRANGYDSLRRRASTSDADKAALAGAALASLGVRPMVGRPVHLVGSAAERG